MKERDIEIDIAKGIGILLVIVGHCNVVPYMPYRHFIFTFHMPLFFIFSGFFFRKKEVKSLLKSDVKYLMLPYLLTCLTIIILSFFKSLFKGSFTPVLYNVAATFVGSGSQHSCLYLANLPSIGAIWFFPALLVCRNVYNFLSFFSIRKRLFFSTAIYLVATIIGRYIIFIPFSVLCGLSAIIFYAIGNYYNTEKPELTWIFWIVGVLCWASSFFFSNIYMVQPRTDLYFVDIIGATTATFLVYKISGKFSMLFKRSAFLPWIGRNSMYILCFHLIDLDISVSSKITQKSHSLTLLLSMIIIPLVFTWIYVHIKRRICQMHHSFIINTL